MNIPETIPPLDHLDQLSPEQLGQMIILESRISAPNLQIVQGCIQAGAFLDVQDYSRWTSLHFAASKGHLEVLNALIAAGASLDIQSIDDETPLHVAARYANVEIIKALLNAGASKKTGDRFGFLPWHLVPDKIKLQCPELQP